MLRQGEVEVTYDMKCKGGSWRLKGTWEGKGQGEKQQKHTLFEKMSQWNIILSWRFCLLYFSCMWVFACIYVCALHRCWCSQRSEEGIKFPETGITNGCEDPCRCISLQQMKSTTENHNLSKWSVVKPKSNGYIYKATPPPKAQGLLQIKGGKIEWARWLGSLLGNCVC